MKIVYYKLIKITINALELARIILKIVIWHYNLRNFIILDRIFLFISKSWSLLYYFFKIKRCLLIAFHLQTNSQTKKQNSIIEVYLWVFINFKQNDKVRLFLMAKFWNNNAKNTSTSHIFFKLNCDYYPCIFFNKNINCHS